MDHHKSLYKDQRSHTPRQHITINRKLQEDNRAKHRRNRFQDSRKISLSPERCIKEVPISECTENKENEDEQNLTTTRLGKIACKANTEKLTKQEEFIKRFIEWKEAKKNAIIPEKKKPFGSSVVKNRQTTTSSSLVPRGHHKGFRPPAGLKNTGLADKVEENNNLKVKGRHSTYTIVPTPKKQDVEKSTNKLSIARKTSTSFRTKLLDSNKMPSSSDKSLIKNGSKPKISKNINTKTPGGLKKELLRKSPTTSAAKNAVVTIAKSLQKSKSKTTAAQQSAKRELKPRALKMPPPPPMKPIRTVTQKSGGAVAKIKDLDQKNKKNVKPTKQSPLKNSSLAKTLKAKKPLNNKKGNLSTLKINSEKIVNILKRNELNDQIQTPRDFATLNPFSEFVTSTKIKDCSQTLQIEGTSTKESSSKKSQGNSSAKRNILAKDSDENNLMTAQEGKKRFNFIRYSETNGNDIDNECQRIDVADANDKTVVEGLGIIETTPIKSGPEERPPNYLSPFVSVTRGKVSLKKEKEKRNSIYLQNAKESHDSPSEIGKENSPIYSVEVRRTLEAVRYFRKQLQDEIDRLHKQCDIWEAYKKENLDKIQNANGEDMINVTIGQTRLLTSKKFMQFKGLIDRCEAGATGVGAVEYDGSENTKPITSVDLEGFWSMLGLQVDNLDKRFENLNRWKANEWIDPDEVKPVKKNNLTKVKKSKTAQTSKPKPNSALQQMLRKMQAEMKKNKNKDEDTNEIIVLTSSKQKQRRSANSNKSTPRKSKDRNESQRLSITVKDRKYFSPVKTVLTVCSPNRRASLRRKSVQESPKLRNSLQTFNNALDDLRKSVLITENSRRISINPISPMMAMKENNCKNAHDLIDEISEETKKETLNKKCLSPHNSPVPTARKSILKTPGTAKSKLRNVIFNEKLRVKKFNFLINDDKAENGEGNVSHEEELVKLPDDETSTFTERTLSLRNRKVRLRPSCEIVIPKN